MQGDVKAGCRRDRKISWKDLRSYVGKGRDTSAFCNINAWSKGSYPADNEKHENFGSISYRVHARKYIGCSRNRPFLLEHEKNANLKVEKVTLAMLNFRKIQHFYAEFLNC